MRLEELLSKHGDPASLISQKLLRRRHGFGRWFRSFEHLFGFAFASMVGTTRCSATQLHRDIAAVRRGLGHMYQVRCLDLLCGGRGLPYEFHREGYRPGK